MNRIGSLYQSEGRKRHKTKHSIQLLMQHLVYVLFDSCRCYQFVSLKMEAELVAETWHFLPERKQWYIFLYISTYKPAKHSRYSAYITGSRTQESRLDLPTGARKLVPFKISRYRA